MAAPEGAQVDTLPDDCTEETIGDTTYYVLDDTYYVYSKEDDLYKVVSPSEAAM